MPYGDHMYTGDGWGWGMGLFMLLFWLLAIGGGVVLWRLLTPRGGPLAAGGPPHETPLDVLKKRYARGEIQRGEYEEKKKDLE